jgi:hypothetical protein
MLWLNDALPEQIIAMIKTQKSIFIKESFNLYNDKVYRIVVVKIVKVTKYSEPYGIHLSKYKQYIGG